MKCWGYNFLGQLGQGDAINRGDGPGEMGNNLPAISLGTGRTAIKISTGDAHVCAVLDDVALKCWGSNQLGALGVGDSIFRGDGPGEMGDSLPAAALGTGRTPMAISVGGRHTCTLRDNATIACWGQNLEGQLGIGDTDARGDGPNEMGNNLRLVDL